MENIATHEDQFFILLERVGAKGKYQRCLFLLSFGLWFVTAFLILSIAFLLLPNKFVCNEFPNQQECQQYVCSLPEEEWHHFESQPLFNSIVTDLGDYHCQYETDISSYKMVLFLGIFLGYFVFMHFSDNMGRRFGMLLTWSTTVVGLLLVTCSRDMVTVSAGLLLAGAGCESNMRINLAMLNEMVDSQLRQKYSLILQCSFGVAGIMVSVGYYYLRNWRIVNTVFCTVPSLIFLAIMAIFLEDTPNHLAKKGTEAVLASLGRIADFNGFECLVTASDVHKVMEMKWEHQQAQKKVTLTVVDLIRFPSLKKNTLHLCLVFFFLSSLYIGPNSAINRFEVNIFLLQIILSISDCIAFPIACYFIAHSQRKTIGLRCFLLSALFNFLAFCISNDQDCPTCFSHLAKLFLMFLFRFCVSYYYGVLFIYTIEIYPEQIRTIGFGTVSAMGALGAVATQKILQLFDSYHKDPLIYFAVISLLCLYSCSKLPETQGAALPVQIEELKVARVRQIYEPSEASLDMSRDHLEVSTPEKSRAVEENNDSQ